MEAESGAGVYFIAFTAHTLNRCDQFHASARQIEEEFAVGPLPPCLSCQGWLNGLVWSGFLPSCPPAIIYIIENVPWSGYLPLSFQAESEGFPGHLSLLICIPCLPLIRPRHLLGFLIHSKACSCPGNYTGRAPGVMNMTCFKQKTVPPPKKNI